MNRRTRGASLKLYLWLIVAVGLFAWFLTWRANYGVTGHVDRLNFNTRNAVAFIRQNGPQEDLYVVDTTTGVIKRLTQDGASKRSPVWSPDGRSLCYAAQLSTQGTVTYQLFVLGDGSPVQITYGSSSKDAAQFRADGKLIAYLAGGSVKSVAPNGSALPQIYPLPERDTTHGQDDSEQDASAQNPTAQDPFRGPPVEEYVLSPNGRYVALIQSVEGEGAAAAGQADWFEGGGAGKSNVPGQPATVADPERVLLVSEAAGTVPRLLVTGNRTDLAWFPDGRSLAVALSTRQNSHAILVYRADDPNLPPRALFVSAGYTVSAENLVVSPDGRYVAFECVRLDSSENREVLGISVLPTSAQVPVMVRSAADVKKVPVLLKGGRQPRWSPDGSRLLFWRNRKGGNDIWVAGRDGSGEKNLTKGQGDNVYAAWSPLR